MKRQRLHSLAERWFRLLLRLYPPDFRETMGEDLVQAYAVRARRALDRGAFACVGVCSAALADSLKNGLGERLRPAASWRRGGNWGRDLERARRRLARAPLFAIATTATLTIGLGIFAVVYTAVDRILIEPLPYPNPDDLFMVWERAADRASPVITGPPIAALQTAGGAIEDAAGLQMSTVTLPASPTTDAISIIGMQSTPSLFRLLGIRPALGRGFRPDEGGPGSPRVVVLTDRLWRRLGADPTIVGTPLTIGTTAYTVIGVMPPGFRFSAAVTADEPDLYVPLALDLAAQLPFNHDFLAIVRARHGASPEAVRQVIAIAARPSDAADHHQGHGRDLYPVGLQADMVEEVRPALVGLSFATVFLLLVLTVNLSSLLLARAAERQREVAVSRALGASGTAIVRAMLLEGALLGLLGGLGGVLAGRWGMRLLVALGPTDLPRRDDIVLDWRVALVVVTVGVILGLAAAASPAAWASRVPLESLVATGSLRGTRTYGRLRRSLIVVQVALSLVLLSAGALVVRSFERLLTVDPGFRPAGVLTFQVSLGRWLFPAEADAFAFQDRVTDAFRSVPGVTAVSATRTLPIAGGTNVTALTIPGAPGNTGDANRDTAIVDRIFVRSGYVDAIGIRVLAGRAFAGGHGPGVREALIDRALARQFFPTGDPIGASIRCEGQTLVIIGVIEQARMYDLYRDGRPQLLVRAEDYEGRRPSYFVVHTNGDPRALSALVTPIVRRVDRRVAVSDVRTMNEIVAERRSRERLSAVLIGGLALGALVLVAMGLVGVISGTVTRRRGELAIRMALGATHRRVLRLVVGDGALLVGLGVLLGVPGVYAAGALVRGLLVDVSPWDPATLVAVAAGLFLVALAACYAPARRVLRIDPAPLLRQE